MRAIVYRRVSTAEQADSGLGLEAQRVALGAECARRGWTAVEHIADGTSARSLRRPGLSAALGRLAAGEADVLLASRADRIVRSLRDWVELTERSRHEGWALVALDAPGDPTTPHGEAMQSMQVVFAQLERRLIGQRTREALAVKRAAGVKLGRPRTLPSDVRQRIRRMREQDGYSFRAIADTLNTEGVATAQGGRQWYPASVRKIVLSA